MDDEPTDTTAFEWWYFHAVVVLVWVPVFVVALALLVYPTLDPAGSWLFALLPFASALFAVVPAYYFDAQTLDRSGEPWRPNWQRWALFSILLTPLVVAPVYLWQRHRHVGTP